MGEESVDTKKHFEGLYDVDAEERVTVSVSF